MDDIELVEKIVICPDESKPNKRMFLSNIDLTLLAYQDSASFFDPPSSQMSFSEICNKLYGALRQMINVHYDFMAGRLVPSSEGDDRFEIDCNGAGIFVATAKTDKKLSEFGEMSVTNAKLKKLVGFLYEEDDEEIDLKDRPLTSLQLTQFGCGSLALASHYNHCTLDGVAISDFEKNLAALTRGADFTVIPNSDRTFLKARSPLKINHPHYEYSKTTNNNHVFTSRSTSGIKIITKPRSMAENRVHVLHLSPQQVSIFKKKISNTSKKISSFQVVAVRVWRARSIAMKMPEEEISTMLFPVEVRKWIVAEVKEKGVFAGNALVPGFARATVKELKEEEEDYLIRKVQEGIERIDEEYVRSGIDWLEENRGVPCSENSFSLVAWWKLGLEDQEFAWGRVKCATPLELKPGLVMMLPGTEGEGGGLNICLDLPEDQLQEFCRIMLQE
ncbi:hypothetical protein QN277_023273 [Acacia crassicarpa]|nr:hypothetical protein QN277_023273 [Acacia crassicarpa]